MMKFLLSLALATLSFALNAQTLFNESALINNLKYLSSDSLQGRKTGSEGSAMARTFIKKQFSALNLIPFGDNYEMPFEFAQRSGTKLKGINLVGWIKGTGEPEEYIVLSAHYDHLGIHDEKIFNGTDDNASGTSALFALAEYFTKNKPKHSIIIVAFDAEEMGLQGARAFVNTPPVAVEKIKVNINMDMVARADKNELYVCGTFQNPQLKRFFDGVDQQEQVKLKFGHDDPEKDKGSNNWISSSDHGPFHKANIPFVYFGVEDHKDYHKETDEFQFVNPATYKSCVRLILKAAVNMDKGLK